MVYMLNFGRPNGIEPKIFINKPEVPPRESPWDPFVEEFDNEFQARKYYKEYYPSLCKELEVVNA